jgi:hypothetical protein
MNPQASVWLLVGFLGLHLFNRFLTAFVCEKDPGKQGYAIGVIPMLGIGFHSFIDGFIYSIAFTASLLTGYLATLGMVLHEFLEGIITYLLLVRGGFSARKAMFLAFLAAAATTPLGMLVSYPLISAIDRETLGALLSLSAGASVCRRHPPAAKSGTGAQEIQPGCARRRCRRRRDHRGIEGVTGESGLTRRCVAEVRARPGQKRNQHTRYIQPTLKEPYK